MGMRRIHGLIVAAGIPSASQAAMVKSLLITTRPVNHIPVKGPGPEWFFYAVTSGIAGAPTNVISYCLATVCRTLRTNLKLVNYESLTH